MNRNRGIRWLYGELPTLVGEGIVPAEVAEKLRRRYGEPGEPAGPARIALTLSAILGAVLIGSGVILLLAHNWDDLSRPARTVLSLLPLLAAQALCGWCLWRGKDSAPWREGASTLLLLAAGASISLVSQTYQISGDFGAFLLTWMLLGLPLVYLMDATLPAALFFVGATFWCGYVRGDGGYPQWFFLLILAAAPHVWRLWRENRYGQRTVWLGWTMTICFTVALGICLDRSLPGLWIVAYSGFFAVLYLAGAAWAGDAPAAWQRPFHSAGAVGTAVLSLLLTNSWPWEEVGWNHYRTGFAHHDLGRVIDLALAGGLFLCSLLLWSRFVWRREALKAVLGIAPLVAVVGYALTAGADSPKAAMLLFNLYVLVMGVATVVAGIRQVRMGTVNGGMLVLAVLIVARFFDSDLPFLARGLGFIVVGIGFLAVNVYLLARKRRQP